MPKGAFKRLKKLHEDHNQPCMIVFDDNYKYIDFLFQIIVYGLQRGYISKIKWVHEVFRKYLTKLAEYEFPEEKLKRIEPTENEKIYKEYIEEGMKFDYAKKTYRREFKINLEDIDQKVLEQSLNYIVNGYFSPYNPNSFGVYVRKTVVSVVKTYKLKEAFPFNMENKILSIKTARP